MIFLSRHFLKPKNYKNNFFTPPRLRVIKTSVLLLRHDELSL
ncbi:hypothetical protein M153_1450000201 [Pseudoloma neurophilia]|uniref:Uncharacterized protein n=1 Tax=Pseudoloma neurophilia TaxID=146866 RepID=A0A0R0LV28_9MICR|nr:hypothetical protein M153_1450000201 [Pseudoloma neurophilia]